MLATLRVWTLPYVYDDAYWMAQPWSIAAAPVRVGAWLSDGLPWGPHLIALMLHVVNGALLWTLARPSLSDVGLLLMLTLAWLHPLPLQAVFYVTGGREVWLATLALCAVLGGLRGGVVGWTLGIGALVAAACVKLSAVPLLAVISAIWAVRHGLTRAYALALLCGLMAVSVPLVVSLETVRLWAMSLVGYLAFVAWPGPLAIVHDWRALSVAAGLAALVFLAACGEAAWRLSRPAWWAWLWIVGLTLPRAVMPEAPMLTEAHTYLPFLAVWLAIGASLDVFLKGPTWLTPKLLTR